MVKVPERLLIPFPGVVISSDGEIIDQVERIFDLAGYIIRERLKTPLIDLSPKRIAP